MNVLVACEYSGRVRDAFIRRGHTAMSCDILPSDSDFGPHYRGDVHDILKNEWDLMVGFPPCTKLSKVGAPYWKRWREDGSQAEAFEFFMSLAEARIPRIAIENPVGYVNSHWRKPDQIIQPWWFGDPWIKTTCLWLKDLPHLAKTNVVEPQGHWVSGGTGLGREEGAYAHATYKSNAGRAHARSITFQGIADAMAAQWPGAA